MPTVDSFKRLASRWKQESATMSSSGQMADLQSYQEIIALGPEVIPLILVELQTEPDFWFNALRALTGQDPVVAEHRGNLDLMAQDWTSWGAEHGYI